MVVITQAAISEITKEVKDLINEGNDQIFYKSYIFYIKIFSKSGTVF
ncbi:hypothetical protein [Ureibacillus sp. GCM10028918]